MLVAIPDLPRIDPIFILVLLPVILGRFIYRRLHEKLEIRRKEKVRSDFVDSKRQTRDYFHEKILEFDFKLLFESGFYDIYHVDEINPATGVEEFRIVIQVEGQEGDELLGDLVQILVSCDEKEFLPIVLTVCTKDTLTKIGYQDNFPSREDLLRAVERHLKQFAASRDNQFAHG